MANTLDEDIINKFNENLILINSFLPPFIGVLDKLYLIDASKYLLEGASFIQG